MKIAILTCSNAREYLEINILPYLDGAELEFANHKEKLKEESYDIAIVACDDTGLRTSVYEITSLDDEFKTPVADLRSLDQKDLREKALPEEMKKKVAKALFKYLLRTKSGDELLHSLMDLSLSS